MMTAAKTITGAFRKILLGALLGAVVGGLFSACSSMPQGPTYTEDELRVMCERRGGWWRGSLIPGYCEFQGASLVESP